MANTDYQSVTEYIAAQPARVRRALKKVRSAVRKGMPGAEEVISYQIPACRLLGYAALYFAGWAEHYSLYPTTDRFVAAFKKDAASFAINKRTVRFPLDQPVPVALIERMAAFRAKEAAVRRKNRVQAAARKKGARRGRASRNLSSRT